MSEILLKQEIAVIETVREYLEKYNSFSSRNIIPFINAKFGKLGININNQGIRAILKTLVEKGLVVEGSRLIKDDILLNSNRKLIYEYIVSNPGVHFNKIVKKCNLSIFTVEWHLNMLIKFKFIRKEKIDNLQTYFDFSVDSEKSEVFHILSREKYRRIIEYLKLNDEEGCTKTHLSEELEMHYNTLSKYISRLENFGLLLRKKLPNKTLYFLNEELYNRLKKELEKDFNE